MFPLSPNIWKFRHAVLQASSVEIFGCESPLGAFVFGVSDQIQATKIFNTWVSHTYSHETLPLVRIFFCSTLKYRKCWNVKHLISTMNFQKYKNHNFHTARWCRRPWNTITRGYFILCWMDNRHSSICTSQVDRGSHAGIPSHEINSEFFMSLL